MDRHMVWLVRDMEKALNLLKSKLIKKFYRWRFEHNFVLFTVDCQNVQRYVGCFQDEYAGSILCISKLRKDGKV